MYNRCISMHSTYLVSFNSNSEEENKMGEKFLFNFKRHDIIIAIHDIFHHRTMYIITRNTLKKSLLKK